MYGNSYGQSVNMDEKLIKEKLQYSAELHCWLATTARAYYTSYLFIANVTAGPHLSILQSRLLTTRTHYYPQQCIYQQDKNPKHKAKNE
jgi:hypothetical protein